MEEAIRKPAVTTPSERLAEKLLQGWTMLSQHCPSCGRVPLMRDLDKKDWCICCNQGSLPPREGQQLQQSLSEEETSGELDVSPAVPQPTRRKAANNSRKVEAVLGTGSLKVGNLEGQKEANERHTGAAEPLKELWQEGDIAAKGDTRPQGPQDWDRTVGTHKIRGGPSGNPPPASESQLAADAAETGGPPPPSSEAPEESQSSDAPPTRPTTPLMRGSASRNATLENTRALLLQRIQVYNGLLQRPVRASLESDTILLKALEEALEALRSVETLLAGR